MKQSLGLHCPICISYHWFPLCFIHLCALSIAYIHCFYSARNARIASAVLATAIPSVRRSVCPSVTRRYCVKPTARSTVQFSTVG